MNFLGIIPARYKSSRFPGKPLAKIKDISMIVRTYESAKKWGKWDNLVVATDDNRIAEECKNNDIPFVMTVDNHTDCLDRCCEAANKLSKDIHIDRVIIVQGDEPLFNVETLDVEYDETIINFYTATIKEEEHFDPNCVKVVVSNNQNAIYFSRYSIPYEKNNVSNKRKYTVYKQIGVYAFSLEMLNLYNKLKPSNLELEEGIGLLRLIENDIPIKMKYTMHDSISVDTVEDLKRIEDLL